MKFVGEPAEQEVDLDQLENAISDFPIELCVVFGSHVRGEESSLSDLDLAAVFEEDVSDRYSLMDQITAEIVKQTGVEAVDLVDLEECGPEIGYRAAKDGKLITGSEERLMELRNRFFHLKMDFRPVKSEWRENMRQRIREDSYGRA